ncbi:MAG: DNA-directed RNA polymerase subunit alpha [Patescibacteria group bacterium]|nr:DNA-directed RNA polymerase subunit alpha [Patescibacteria group bacterium]MCL5093811.1 DNA-directed RNA polymerase subunit alpha [Patescibacteria group bacterium]
MLYDIHLPEIKEVMSEKNVGVFAIEPMYPGFGMTLGNSLRRVILSSLPGAAVTAVKIDGVPHEFTTIPGVKEDVVEIILNLKRLSVKCYSDEPVYLTLSSSGEGEVRAKDIKPDANVEIMNPDLLIATLSSKSAKFNMELKVEKGRGYVPVEKRSKEKLELGMIAIDALYSPIRRVRYNVENTRVGQMTDLDKLVFEIETNGVISPKEAIETASDILVQHFLALSGKESANLTREISEEAEGGSPAAKISVDEINLSSRTSNALINNDLKTVEDVLKVGKNELKNLKGFGAKAYEEVLEKISELGFNFEEKEE